MEIRNMNMAELSELRTKLAEELRGEVTAERVTEINSQLDEIEKRERELDDIREARARAAAAVAGGQGDPIATPAPTTETRSLKEIRNSHEYIEAYARYIKTGRADECRALLSENAPQDGQVPVPELVETRVRQAWENDKIFSRVARTYVKGNLKVGFEVSASDAAVHTEGAEGPAEEELVLGIVTMVPAHIKKWITVSDEVLALGAEDFLAYIYDELTYKIIQKAADIVVAKIVAAPSTSTTKKVGVAQVDGLVSADTIIDAIAALGDSAQNNVIIASGSTIADVKKAALLANYAFDPFQGLEVIQKDGVTGAIVGDLTGVQANLPSGDSVTFKFDDLSLSEHDLVKIVGKLYAAIEVVGPKMLAYIDGVAPSE